MPRMVVDALSFNSRGFSSPATVRGLRKLVKSHVHTILCALETQIHKIRVEKLANTLGFDKDFVVSSDSWCYGPGVTRLIASLPK